MTTVSGRITFTRHDDRSVTISVIGDDGSKTEIETLSEDHWRFIAKVL